MATEWIVRGAAEMIVILPTGAGKSVLFMLPALIERTQTTVLIVPLKSLRVDMSRRLSEAGISNAVYNPKIKQVV